MKITGVTPWLVKSGGSYWGEFLFVEVTTDEGISGWGEVTTTTRLANRALRAIPPLIKAYLRTGGFVGEGAYVDEDFNTIDVCVVMDTGRMTERYLQFYQRTRGRRG